MLFSDVVTQARDNTLHDADTQVTDAQILRHAVKEYQRLRRWLCLTAPNLCQVTVSAQAVASPSCQLTKSALVSAVGGGSTHTVERIRRIEVLVGDLYQPIRAAGPLEGQYSPYIWWEEFPTYLQFGPASAAAGTYQVTYTKGPPAAADISTSTVVDLPLGVDDALVEYVSAWIRQRHNEDPKYHLGIASDIIATATSLLRNRTGEHGQSALKDEAGCW